MVYVFPVFQLTSARILLPPGVPHRVDRFQHDLVVWPDAAEVAISISRPPETLDTSIGAYLNCAAVPLKPLGNILVFTAFLTAERRGALCVQLFLCFCR